MSIKSHYAKLEKNFLQLPQNGPSVAAKSFSLPFHADGLPSLSRNVSKSTVRSTEAGPAHTGLCVPEGELLVLNSLLGESPDGRRATTLEMGILQGPRITRQVTPEEYSTSPDKDILAGTMHNKHLEIRVRLLSRLAE
jgi:hypothetical protein